MSWHTAKEAADLIGLSDEMVYRLCASGRLAHRRVGLKPGRGKIQISDEGIAAFLASCVVGVKDAAPDPPGARPRKTPVLSGRPDGKPLTRQWGRTPDKRS